MRRKTLQLEALVRRHVRGVFQEAPGDGGLSDEEFFELDKRDKRVMAQIQDKLVELGLQRENLRREISALDREQFLLEDAVRREHWWELTGVLSEKDIDSLSEVSPVGLYNYLFDLRV